MEKYLSKTAFESYTSEILLVLEEIDYSLKYLQKWMKPQRVSGGIMNFPSKGKIYPEPYGTVLVIAP